MENDRFKIEIMGRETFLNKKIREIIPKAPYFVMEEVKTNYGSMYFTNLFCDADLLLNYLKELKLEKGKYENAKQRIEKNKDILDSGQVDLGLLGDFEPEQNLLSAITGDYRDSVKILSNHPDVLREGLAALYFYTIPIPSSGSKLTKFLKKLKRWDNDYHSGFGPIYETIWYQGWINERGKNVEGFAVKVRFVMVQGSWTLSSLERRIDRAIEPIKTYLSQEGVGPKAEPGTPFTEKCLLCQKDRSDELIWVGVCESCYEKL